MTHVVIAFDGTDANAAERRSAAMAEHVAFITGEAEAGRLVLGLPLLDEAGHSLGSLMFVAGDEAAREAYLAAEPFARLGVWQRVESHAFRVAPLPYQPWPSPNQPPPTGRTHTVIIAWDGTDEASMERRLAARSRHLTRVRPMAETGTLVIGGAILDAADRMVGSIAVTRHISHAAAREMLAGDPYVTGDVWRDISLYATRLRPLAYRPLPQA